MLSTTSSPKTSIITRNHVSFSSFFTRDHAVQAYQPGQSSRRHMARTAHAALHSTCSSPLKIAALSLPYRPHYKITLPPNNATVVQASSYNLLLATPPSVSLQALRLSKPQLT
eukprot:scaffold299805_cov21-Tisochrysis_lutea.AAC.2